MNENAVVTISLPGDGWTRLRDFNATVVARIRSGVILEPFGADLALLPARSEDVFVSFANGAGLVALKGVLSRESSGLHFQVQDGVRVQGRRYTRVDAELPVTLRPAGAADDCPGTTLNIAQEGLLVRAPLQVTVDERLDVALTLPTAERPLELRARVVRHSGGLVALQLVDCNERQQAMIAAFVVEQRIGEMRAAQAVGP